MLLLLYDSFILINPSPQARYVVKYNMFLLTRPNITMRPAGMKRDMPMQLPSTPPPGGAYRTLPSWVKTHDGDGRRSRSGASVRYQPSTFR